MTFSGRFFCLNFLFEISFELFFLFLNFSFCFWTFLFVFELLFLNFCFWTFVFELFIWTLSKEVWAVRKKKRPLNFLWPFFILFFCSFYWTFLHFICCGFYHKIPYKFQDFGTNKRLCLFCNFAFLGPKSLRSLLGGKNDTLHIQYRLNHAMNL